MAPYPQHPMRIALDEAQKAGAAGEVPVGAVVLGPDGILLSRAGNRTEAANDPTAHAEILALRAASVLRGSPRLPDCTLVVTLEPCPMCAHAISLFRVRRLVFGAYDPKGGGVDHGARIFDAPSCHHRPEIVGGVHETHAAALLRDFFKLKRNETAPHATEQQAPRYREPRDPPESRLMLNHPHPDQPRTSQA